MYNTSKFTTTIVMAVSCILCACSNTVATERITFYSSSDQVKLSLEALESALYNTSRLNPKIPIKNIQPKSKTNLIPVLVVGGIVTIGIMAAVISNNKDKDKTNSGANTTDPVPPTTGSSGTDTKTTDDGTIPALMLSAHSNQTDPQDKMKLVIYLLAQAIKYWEEWPGTLQEKERLAHYVISSVLLNNADIQNTHLLGSIAMTRALHDFLVDVSWKLDATPNVSLESIKHGRAIRTIAKGLFEEKDIAEYLITNALKGYTDKHMTEDLIKILAIADDIKRQADIFAQFILNQCKDGADTLNQELIAFLPTKDTRYCIYTYFLTSKGFRLKSCTQTYVVTPEGLTNYLKWCADQLVKNTGHIYLGTLQMLTNMGIAQSVRAIKFFEHWPGTPEQKEEFTKKIVSAFKELKDHGNTIGSVFKCMIDFIVEKYNANFIKEVKAPFSEEELKQDHIKVYETINYILDNANSLSAKIVPYFNGPVITTNQGLLDFFSECEPKDNPNFFTHERLAGHLRWVANQLHILLELIYNNVNVNT